MPINMASGLKEEFPYKNCLKGSITETKEIFNHTESLNFYTFLLRVLTNVRSLVGKESTEQRVIIHQLKADYKYYSLKNDENLRKFNNSVLELQRLLQTENTAWLVTVLQNLGEDRKTLLARIFSNDYAIKHGVLPKLEFCDAWVAEQLKNDLLLLRPPYLKEIADSHMTALQTSIASFFPRTTNESKKKKLSEQDHLTEDEMQIKKTR